MHNPIVLLHFNIVIFEFIMLMSLMIMKMSSQSSFLQVRHEMLYPLARVPCAIFFFDVGAFIHIVPNTVITSVQFFLFVFFLNCLLINIYRQIFRHLVNPMSLQLAAIIQKKGKYKSLSSFL